jgi:hypothetical protein
VSVRFWLNAAFIGKSSPSSDPNKTSSASVQSDGQLPYGDEVSADPALTVCPRLEVVIMYGRIRSAVSSASAAVAEGLRAVGLPNDRRKDSKLWINLDRAKESRERKPSGRTCTICALVGSSGSEGSDSPLCVGGVGGR